MLDRVTGIGKELARSGTIVDPAREKLIETRKSLVATWMKAADVLDAQGEVVFAGDVRYFASHLPPVITDRQQLAVQFIRFTQQERRLKPDVSGRDRPKNLEMTR